MTDIYVRVKRVVDPQGEGIVVKYNDSSSKIETISGGVNPLEWGVGVFNGQLKWDLSECFVEQIPNEEGEKLRGG